MFIGVSEDFFKSGDCFFAHFLEGSEAEEPGVDGWAFQRGDRSFDGFEVELRDAWLEAFWGDAVDGTGAGVIAVSVAADAGVIPIGDVKSAVWSYDDVGGAEEDLGVVGISTTADEVGAGVFLVGVGGGEVALLEFEGGALGFGLVVEDGVFSGFAGEEGAVVASGKGSVFIHADAGGGSPAVDVAGVHRAGVVLTPMGASMVLTGAFDGAISLLGIAGEVSGAAVFEDVGDAAGRWIVVIVLEGIAEGVERLLVGITVAVADDFTVGAVGVHADGEAGGPDVAIIRALAGDGDVIDEEVAATAAVWAAHVEILAGVVFKDGAAVSVVEVEFSVGSAGDGVEGVVVVAGVEAGEEDFAFVDRGVEPEIAVDVGVDEEFGWLGNVDDVVKNGDAEGGDKTFFLHEGVGGVGFAVAISVLQDRDTVAIGAASVVAAVIHSFSDPHATGVIDIDVGGIVEVG